MDVIYEWTGSACSDPDWFEYNVENRNYIVTFSDGSSFDTKEDDVEAGSNYFYYDGREYSIVYSHNQDSSSQWQLGKTYTATGTIQDTEVSGDFDVNVVETPVDSITVDEITVIENDGGEWEYHEDSDEDWYCYDLISFCRDYSIELKDGETLTSDSDGDIRYNNKYHRVRFKTDQSYSNQWKAGHGPYYATLCILGAETQVKVNIIGVESVAFGKSLYEIIERTNGYEDWDDDESHIYWRYNPRNVLTDFTVKLTNGQTLTSYYDEDWGEYVVAYNGNKTSPYCYVSQNYTNQWKTGETKTADVELMGKTVPVQFKVIESPVVSVDLLSGKVYKNTGGTNRYVYESYGENGEKYYWDSSSKYEDEVLVGRYYKYDISSLVESYKITLKDGNTLQSDEEGYVTYQGKKYYLEYSNPQSYDKQWGSGEHEVDVSILGYSKPVKATIVDDGYIKHTHKWDAGVVTEAAFCTSKGVKTFKCTVARCGETKTELIPQKGHTAGAAATCTTAQNCATCGAELEQVKGHAVALKEISRATTDDAGEIVESCICGQVMTTTAIKKIKSVKLPKAEYVYNGKAQKPAVTVKAADGKKLVMDTDYTVTYKNNKAAGKATVTVKFKGNYAGTEKLTFKINPKKTAIKKPVAAKKAITVKWTKVKKAQASGYEVLIATNKKFTKEKKQFTVKSYNTGSKKISKLKAKKTYYVKVRSYKTVGKENTMEHGPQ